MSMKDVSYGLVLCLFATHLMLAFFAMSYDPGALSCIDARAIASAKNINNQAILAGSGCNVTNLVQNVQSIRTSLNSQQNIAILLWAALNAIAGSIVDVLTIIFNLFTLVFIGWFTAFQVILFPYSELAFVGFFFGSLFTIIQLFGLGELFLEVARSLPRN